jgi:uncharacterized protein YndB with AHSA1/START domain
MPRLEIIAEPGKQEISFACVFDAPRELVFKAYTDPDLLPQWLGPKQLAMTSVETHLTPGGRWRFVHRAPDGGEYAFHGVYHDVVEPERIVRTFEFAGAPGHVSLETATFEERDGRTRVVGTSVFQSVGDRDAHLAAGMEKGLGESLDRLADLLRQMQRSPARSARA